MCACFCRGFAQFSIAFNKIANGFSLGRRFIRIGSLPSTIQGIQQSARESNAWMAFCGVMSKAATLSFILLDHTSWVSRQGVFKMDYDYYSYHESLCWFLSVAFMVLGDVHLWLAAEQQERAVRAKIAASRTAADRQPAPGLRAELATVQQRKVVLVLNFVRNFCDIPIALHGMFKFKNVSQLVWNLLGLLSSAIGGYQSWPAAPSWPPALSPSASTPPLQHPPASASPAHVPVAHASAAPLSPVPASPGPCLEVTGGANEARKQRSRVCSPRRAMADGDGARKAPAATKKVATSYACPRRAHRSGRASAARRRCQTTGGGDPAARCQPRPRSASPPARRRSPCTAPDIAVADGAFARIAVLGGEAGRWVGRAAVAVFCGSRGGRRRETRR